MSSTEPGWAVDAREGLGVVPRPVVVVIVLALTGFLGADVIGQFVVAGHAASPVLDGAILAVLGGVVAASRGPRPETPPPPDHNQATGSDTGRHRNTREETGP